MREDFKRPIRVITHTEEEKANHNIGFLIGLLLSIPYIILVNILYYFAKTVEFLAIKSGAMGIFVVSFIIFFIFFKIFIF
jgi:hypothetical protein